jgi:hypothetical protein
MPETPRDLFNKVMRFECPGRTLCTLGGIWPSTFERWAQEGKPAHLNSILRLIEHFGLQPHIWSGPAAEVFTYPAFEHTVLRETQDTVTYRNAMGIVCTDFKKDAYKSMPHFEDFPVHSRAEWSDYKARLQWHPDRVGQAWRNQCAAWKTQDAPVILALNRGGSLYGCLRDLLGMEPLSVLFYDDPEWIADMMDTALDLFLHCADALFAEYVPDAVCLWEDMAYKNGPLLGPAQVRELMLPRYKIMVRKLRDKGVPFILLDSDGRIDDLLPIWLEAGIDGVVPMEAQCGMDVALFRRRYPRMLMMGGIDKKALATGPAAIDREMDKVSAAIASGGYVPFFDHGLPHDVSWDQFTYFVRRLKDVCS